jgi:hypothetical protein
MHRFTTINIARLSEVAESRDGVQKSKRFRQETPKRGMTCREQLLTEHPLNGVRRVFSALNEEDSHD